MTQRLTFERCTARAEALEECADHLEQNWTDDPIERQEGQHIERNLRATADWYRTKAAKLKRKEQSKHE